MVEIRLPFWHSNQRQINHPSMHLAASRTKLWLGAGLFAGLALVLWGLRSGQSRPGQGGQGRSPVAVPAPAKPSSASWIYRGTNFYLQEVATNADGSQVIRLGMPTNLLRYTLSLQIVKGPQDKEVGLIQVRRDKDPEVLQTLRWDPTENSSLGRGEIQIHDINFDGYTDFGLLNWWGATGNHAYHYWLFDPGKGLFRSCDQLDDMSCPWPHPKTRTIRTHRKGGSMGNIYLDEYYQWQNGRLVCVKKVRQYMKDDFLHRWALWLQDTLGTRSIPIPPQFIFEVQELRSGKWVVVTRKKFRVKEY